MFDELPRTGVPHQFASYSEYERAIELLVSAGPIEDATKIWWDMRPSARFKTLEMRITDVCPLIEDGIAIASLFRCILRLLYRLRRQNQRWRHYPPFLVRENRWRAQRYGVEQGLVDFGKGAVVPFPVLLEELFDLIAEDAAYFGCVAEVAHARTNRATRDERRPSACVLRRGAEAGRQRSGGADRRGRRHHRGDHDGTRRFEFDSASCLTCLLVRLKRAGHAAIDIECGTGDIGGLVGCKEQSRVGDVLRRTEAPKRCLREQRLGDHRI